MKDLKKLHVAHTDSSIHFVGTEEECQEYQKSLPYRTDCMKIHDLEDYGQHCYSEGYDNGYDEGQDQ